MKIKHGKVIHDIYGHRDRIWKSDNYLDINRENTQIE